MNHFMFIDNFSNLHVDMDRNNSSRDIKKLIQVE